MKVKLSELLINIETNLLKPITLNQYHLKIIFNQNYLKLKN